MTGYEICARRGGDGEFEVSHTTSDVSCAAIVPVAPECWLEFTVAALSDAGGGPASRPSMPVLTRRLEHEDLALVKAILHRQQQHTVRTITNIASTKQMVHKARAPA